jgi:hypothetical protein
VLIAAHIMNQIPTPNLSNKSPYHLLFSKPPSYHHLKVFGYLCCSSTLTRNRSKFNARAKPCVFIGYPPNSKGYKLFDLVTKSVFVSRDVVFHETVFPFASTLTTFNSNGCLVIPKPISNSSHSDGYSPESSDSSNSNSAPEPIIPPSSSFTPIRKSTRLHHPPGYLQNYHCNLAAQPQVPTRSTRSFSGKQYDLSYVLDYNSLSNSNKHFCLSVSTHFEPKFFHQAVKYSHWREAMAAEIHTLEANNTWLLTDLPPNKPPIRCKWVYNVKLKANGEVERYTARLVAK